MLFRRDVLDRVVTGEVELAFRRWREAEVRSGGSVRTAVGIIEFGDVEIVTEQEITAADVRRAGFDSKGELLESLRQGEDRRIHRIGIRFAGTDPRAELRNEAALSPRELDGEAARLIQIDARSKRGPWTRVVLRLIDQNPAVPARELAEALGRELPRFKSDVRRLKEYGLTESLEIGYRLSPRGQQVLAHLNASDPSTPG
ncbi:hypothetical protein [Streptomyces albipurpureus]|uniref:ASCH domain-containing protein n=1 Tax=Streptomyces albipurpureus TaxID=2897419 RepID=A0ABT0UK23_9ACTN|nr:hypothetical protein [Streptomyces sp. CWNU-1]MCM2388987.1 hypothetical protein [Streptomyces sp. CWNU-1]